MFKKIAHIFILACIMTAFLGLYATGKLLAADVLLETGQRYEDSELITEEWYVETTLIKENLAEQEFTVPLKLVVNGKLRMRQMYAYRYISGSWYGKKVNSSMYWMKVNDRDKMFKACIPYCKLAQQYPLD